MSAAPYMSAHPVRDKTDRSCRGRAAACRFRVDRVGASTHTNARAAPASAAAHTSFLWTGEGREACPERQ